MNSYQHLIGREWHYGKQDCYGIVRDFYKDIFNIDLPNYARPNDFWDHGLNMYIERFNKNNFKVLNCHPSEYQFGDVFLMSIKSNVANHAGVLVDKGMILHHMVNQLSTVTHYRSVYRNNTVAILRHKDVIDPLGNDVASITDFIPDHIKRKFNENFKNSNSTITG